jgi:hypothetical protein
MTPHDRDSDDTGDAASQVATSNAADTDTGSASRPASGRPFAPGNRAAAGRRPKLALLGVPLASADPRFALGLRRASRYRKRRCAEFAAVLGYVSAGASSLLASAALALCASRYLYERAAETGDAEALLRASALAKDARENERAAWDVAARESKARPKPPRPKVQVTVGAARAGTNPKDPGGFFDDFE